LVGLAIVVVAAIAGPFIYIHFIEGTPPAKLALPSTSTTSANGSTSSTSPGATKSLEGTWNVGPGSVAGYRVGEILIGQSTTAVGRTSQVWGSLTIASNMVTAGTITVNMASVESDQAQRNAQFAGRIMDVAKYPTATLVLTKPIVLGTNLATGSVQHYPASGQLTMHGVTNPVSFEVSAVKTSSGVAALAQIPILFSSFGIANPSVGGLVNTSSAGTIEVLLSLTQGPGNKPTSGAGSGAGGSGGGQITVPSTTVPPLKIGNG
jgi:polyisoprenoid-binding protein YceI